MTQWRSGSAPPRTIGEEAVTRANDPLPLGAEMRGAPETHLRGFLSPLPGEPHGRRLGTLQKQVHPHGHKYQKEGAKK